MRPAVAALLALLLGPAAAHGQAVDAVLARVSQERAPLVETLRELVSIDSSSRDIDGWTASPR